MINSPPHQPYLDTLHSSPTCTLAALDWAQYLGSTFGARGALEALRYYQDLGWISESVRAGMVEHLEGLSLSELQARGDTVALDGRFASLANSPFAPHVGSLRYIANVAGVNVDKMLDEVRLQFGEFTPSGTASVRAPARNGDHIPT